MNFPKVFAFTVKTNRGTLRDIVTQAGISPAFDTSTVVNNDPRIFYTKALWDTGATGSVITKTLAEKLGLIAFSKSRMTHAGGTTWQNVYKVHIYLPNGIAMGDVNVAECADNARQFDFIIGMDIITRGDFSITHKGNESLVSFRIPSAEKSIDYTIETNDNKPHPPINPFKGASLNKPCPCGSKKLFKHCHGKK